MFFSNVYFALNMLKENHIVRFQNLFDLFVEIVA